MREAEGLVPYYHPPLPRLIVCMKTFPDCPLKQRVSKQRRCAAASGPALTFLELAEQAIAPGGAGWGCDAWGMGYLFAASAAAAARLERSPPGEQAAKEVGAGDVSCSCFTRCGLSGLCF